MFTTTKTIAGQTITTEWPDHIRPVIHGSSAELLEWLRANDGCWTSKGKEYSAVYHRMTTDLAARPEWRSNWMHDSPEMAAHMEAKKTDEYKAWSLLGHALKAAEVGRFCAALRARPGCPRCKGTGYVSMYARVAGGVCFACFSW